MLNRSFGRIHRGHQENHLLHNKDYGKLNYQDSYDFLYNDQTNPNPKFYPNEILGCHFGLV